jgi:TonB family protein
MSPKVLMLVVLGLVNLAGVARAESPASLLEIAPFCRSLVKARLSDRSGGTLVFDVQRIYVGEGPSELHVPAGHWRQAWGELKEGFEGFFAYSRNPEVDVVFPIVKDQVLATLPSPVSVEEPPPSPWLPLAEVEARLTEIARRHRSLIVTFSSSDDNPAGFQVTFTNHGKEPIAVNRAGRLEYRVSDSQGKALAGKVEPTVASSAPDYVELAPGESTSVAAPASLLEGVPEGPLSVQVLYTNAGRDPSQWSGTRETHHSYYGRGPVPSPRPETAPRPLEVLSTPAPRYTELAKRARVQGEVRVRATVLPGGEVVRAVVAGAELPMGLSPASVEAVEKWRFAPSAAQHEQEIVFEYKLPEYCDPELPPIERIGEHRFRVWAERDRSPIMSYVIGLGEDGNASCSPHTREQPQCAF